MSPLEQIARNVYEQWRLIYPSLRLPAWEVLSLPVRQEWKDLALMHLNALMTPTEDMWRAARDSVDFSNTDWRAMIEAAKKDS